MPDMYFDVDAALSEVPVNILPLLDDTDFKTVEAAVAYNASGMDLRWNFVTSAGAFTSTAVTPTTGGDYDWTHQGDGMYSIEIPASGGASINNDTEGYGWFSGFVTGVLPFRGPIIGFRASAINDSLCDAGTTGLLGPTTAGRTLDVSAGGEAGIDWANVGSPTTAVNLSATNIDTDQVVASVTGAVGSVTGAVGSVTAAVSANVTQFGGTNLTAASGIPEVKINLPVGPIPSLGIIDNGTLQSATSSTAVVRSAAALGDDIPNNAVLEITGGTGAGQTRLIVDYVTSTDTATVNPNWTTNPASDSTYIIRAAPPAPTTASYVPAVNVVAIEGADPTDTIRDSVVDDATRIDASALNTATGTTIPAILTDTAEIGAAGAGLTEAGGTGDHLTAVPWNASWDAEVQSEVQDAIEANHLDHLLAATYDPASKPGAADALLNELVENDGGVSRYTANALEQAPSGTGASATAIADEVQTRTIAAVTVVNGLAANTVTASALASDAVTEIQSGLATAAELAKVPKSDSNVAWNATAAAQIQSEAADALNAYDPPTAAELTSALAAADDAVLAAIAALNNLSAAQVNAEVVDALATDVIADSVPADGSRPTIAQALYMLTQYMMERSVSGTTMTVKKVDGSTTLFTQTLNDATTPTSVTRAS